MELNKNTITEIFKKNFNYPIVETIAGTAIKMNAFAAFHFCNITGASYLNNTTYPFSPKGAMKILREACKYNIVTGIFDNASLLYSPTELYLTQNYLFRNDKYILLKECNSEQEFREEIQNDYNIIEANGLQTTDFIIFRIEAWKHGNGMESFLEYLACEYFRHKGYIVENQITLVHTVGTPDFGGFKLKNSDTGFHIVELAMLRITKNLNLLNNLDIQHVIVGEAKTSTTVMDTQLKKYLNTGLFHKGYEMHPEKSEASHPYFGILSINSDYSLRVEEPSAPYTIIGDSQLDYDEYMKWYENNLKLYIISNLTNAELKTFVEGKKPRGNYSSRKIIDVITSASTEEIIDTVKEVM